MEVDERGMIIDDFSLASAIVALISGFVLGAFYFGGLWWTSQRIGVVRAPGLFFMVSFIVRMAVLLSGMYLVTKGRLLDTAICLISVLIVRRLAVTRVRGAEGGETNWKSG